VDAVEVSGLTDEVRPSCLPRFSWFIDRDCCKNVIIADLMAAMTLSDEGSNVTEMNKIPLSEIENSVHAILNHVPPVLEPSVSVPPPPPPAPSAIRPWQRSSLPRPAAFTPRSKPIGASVRKALDIITTIEKESLKVEATLASPDDFDCTNVVQVAQIRVLLDAAAAHVDSAGRSLKLVTNQQQEVLDYKEKVLVSLKAIDARISFLGSSLPLLPPDPKPVFFDASEFLLDNVTYH
jgi:hypothetical protein